MFNAIEYNHGRILKKEVFLQKDYFKYKCYVNVHYNRSNKSDKKLFGYLYADTKMEKYLKIRDCGVMYSFTVK